MYATWLFLYSQKRLFSVALHNNIETDGLKTHHCLYFMRFLPEKIEYTCLTYMLTCLHAKKRIKI
jgi:hypothetical protein